MIFSSTAGRRFAELKPAVLYQPQGKFDLDRHESVERNNVMSSTGCPLDLLAIPAPLN